ncbi:hypothetical protein [Halorubrum lipolyticum]|uniref:Uncharacterized protein n=1 Tax=Halorubrum lipolyticum DSM 21995 TaxID=1227482 RepID=M0NTA5_9EURY|nr:hypothetical protein [Halorubrum lipolyticum]EMA59860.1 hypothetical protein C469_09566 [Halorubrum lipolyticum DSM 21995]
MGDQSVVDRLRRPEYTGENRCLPCTALNVAIAVVAAVAVASVGLAAGGSRGVATGVGGGVFTAAVAAIALRGYLIPGTPAITRRYVPDRVLEAFGKAETDRPVLESVDDEAVVATLSRAGVLTENGDTVVLTDEFRTAVRDGIEPGEPDAAGVRAAVGADDIRSLGPASFEVDGAGIQRWVSSEAVAVDVALAAELDERVDGWGDLDRDDRRDVLTGLRLRVERCPACDSPAETTVERLDHCCRRPHVAVRSACRECDALLGDHVVPASAADTWIERVDGSEPLDRTASPSS